MRYVIIESGGKQYRAEEGRTIQVDRLALEPGQKLDIERILMMADGDEFMIGTPTLSGIQVKTTVVDHFRGNKVIHYRYSPKKRIRVKGGHRQQYTRLMVDFIGRPGESRKPEKAEPAADKGTKRERGAKPAGKPKAEPKQSPEKAAPKKAAAKKPGDPAPKTKKPATTKTSSSKGKKSTK